MLKKLLLLIVSLSLTACGSLGPNYHRPELNTGTQFTTQTKIPAATTQGLAWWHSFQDSTLNNLLDEAVANNQEMKLAIARVEEARGILAVTNSDAAPSIDAAMSANRNRRSGNSSQKFPNQTLVNRNLQVGLNASYEIDIWGKLRRASEADRANLLGQQANRDAVLITLYSDVAQNYFALRTIDESVQLISNAVKTRQHSFALQQKRFAAGIINETQLNQTETELAAAQIIAEQTKQSQAAYESALAVLLGRSPSAIAHPVIARGKTITQLYKQLTLPKELSSDLLNHRPDLIAAEQNLIAVNANIGATKAAVFPNITLTSAAGYESQALRDLIDPTSLLWNIGASLTQPIYHHGALKGALKATTARKDQAQALYINAVQNAFRDVHDALTQVETTGKITLVQQRQLTTTQNNVRLAELRYQSGYTSLLEFLEAQRNSFQAQSNLLDAQRAQLTAIISLYKAVGGNWGN